MSFVINKLRELAMADNENATTLTLAADYTAALEQELKDATARYEQLQKAIDNLHYRISELQKTGARADTARLDHLAKQYVVVRHPLRYGSAKAFSGTPHDVDGGEPEPWDIRAAIDDDMRD